ncbi:MAG: roadblock/LC7 domain-containing protein [Candidatus Micrarchaeota archaeon]
MTKIDKLIAYLSEKKHKLVQGYVVARNDGILIHSTLRETDPHLAAVMAAIIGSSETFIQSTGAHVRNVTVLIESTEINVLMTGTGKSALLAVITRPDVETYMLIPHVQAVCNGIAKILD